MNSLVLSFVGFPCASVLVGCHLAIGKVGNEAVGGDGNAWQQWRSYLGVRIDD